MEELGKFIFIFYTISYIYLSVICHQDPPSKYVFVDDIKVLRDDYEAFVKEDKISSERANKNERGEATKSSTQEYELEQKEDSTSSQKLPRRCHVCRLFVEEFLELLEANPTKNSKGFYEYSEPLAYESLDKACENMKKYTVTRVTPFRYKKARSAMRQVFDKAQEGSKIKTWSYTLSNTQIDDPTGEIDRITKKCRNLTRYHGKGNILKWLKYHQTSKLMDWFCKEIYLKKNKKGCLSWTIYKDSVIREEL